MDTHVNIQYEMRRNHVLLSFPLMLSVPASFCQGGTNETLGSGFQLHSKSKKKKSSWHGYMLVLYAE